MSNKTSQHILSTSANLLGFCLFVITALHFSDKRTLTYIDELAAIMSILFATSTIFSFISLKTENIKVERHLENIADYLFIIALSVMIIVIVLIALNVIK